MATSSKSAGTLHSSGSEAKTGNIATLPGGFCASEASNAEKAFIQLSAQHTHTLFRLGFQAAAALLLLREDQDPASEEQLGADYLLCQLRDDLKGLAEGFPETLAILMKSEASND